jgi:hypothetical protein
MAGTELVSSDGEVWVKWNVFSEMRMSSSMEDRMPELWGM